MKRTAMCTMVLAVALILAAPITADVPQMINYQGHLTNNAGQPLDTIVSMVFTLYDDSTGGADWWTETHPTVGVDSGSFSVLLGSLTPFGDSAITGGSRWLGIQVGGDPEMTPRTLMGSIPHAFVTRGVNGDIVTEPGAITLYSEAKYAPSYAGLSLAVNQLGSQIVLNRADATAAVSVVVDNTGNSAVLRISDSLVDAHRIELKADDTGTVVGFNWFDHVTGDLVSSITNTCDSSGTEVGFNWFDHASGDTSSITFTCDSRGTRMREGNGIVVWRTGRGTDDTGTVVGFNWFDHMSGDTSSITMTCDSSGGRMRISDGLADHRIELKADDTGTVVSFNWFEHTTGDLVSSITQTCDSSGAGISLFNGTDLAAGLSSSGLTLTSGASDGYVMTSDALGNGTWQWPSFGSCWECPGTCNYTYLTDIDDSVGIGTETPTEKLHVVGNLFVTGKATIGPGHTNTPYNGFVAGNNNAVTSNDASVSGGAYNTASGWGSTIAGGDENEASGIQATVGGGVRDTASGDQSTISGGQYNVASGTFSVIGGGGGPYSADGNVASGMQSTVAGGIGNTATNSFASIGGGVRNVASGSNAATIAGGYQNTASGSGSSVGGGVNNSATGQESAVGGGYSNTASGYLSVVGGGINNAATATVTTIAGGNNNVTSAYDAAVGGGAYNTASGWGATVSGGDGNLASGSQSVIGGGARDTVYGDAAVIAGGRYNVALGNFCVISGGDSNYTEYGHAVVGGGKEDTARAFYSGVFSGHRNLAGDDSYDTACVILGGVDNRVTAAYGAIGGGRQDTVSGMYSCIPGGRGNGVHGRFSMAFGRNVRICDDYRVAFFNGYESGRLGVNRDDCLEGINYPIHVGTNSSNGNGAHLTEGGSWTNKSARNSKDNFELLDGRDVLHRLAKLPMEAWTYKGTDERHIWPCAEDFHEQFDVGTVREDGSRVNEYLAAGDVAGVALIGVQELTKENADLRQRIEQLESLVQALLAQTNGGSDKLASNK